ncbi:glucose-methanol-choline oxidoreductase [Daedalea quercina L-15889]|uniref:Glucose-methanol-choline oxidoreductase n=1 Tax=Daedalea quercina L-15889 TaxID=1314783 RepID=A0A165TJL5_9APHY|nr:glucose-methanol-choline oxidoreductase [Daedalea quercina L-15889]
MISAIGVPRRLGTDHFMGTVGIDAGPTLPKSTGRLHLRSRDPRADPVCDMQYMTAPQDREPLRAALRVTVALARQLRVDGYALKDVHVPDVSSDAALDQYIDENVQTMYHYSSTCRMAPEEGEHPGVVDDALRVHGIRKLHIADAPSRTVQPLIHRAAVYAFAAKCADPILKNAASRG